MGNFFICFKKRRKKIKILDRLSPFIKIYETSYLKRQNVGRFRCVETKKNNKL
jgi:hypothetical protein